MGQRGDNPGGVSLVKMEVLNDDIIIRILSDLDLQSQTTILSVHPRFFNLMSFVWSSQYKTVNLSLFEADFSTEQLDHFFQSICNTVKVIRLRLMTWEQYEVLTSKVYPKVHDFRFATLPSNLLTDADIPKIIKSFPNLTTFSPQGNFSGVHFSKFRQLERLTLTYCKKFVLGNLVNIMKSVQLIELNLCMSDSRSYQFIDLKLPMECVENLESIKFDLEELPWFQDRLKDMKNLKELTFYGPEERNTLKLLLKELGCSTKNLHLKILETCNATETFRTVISAGVRIDVLKIVTDDLKLQDHQHFASRHFDNINQLYFKSCFIEEKGSFNSLMFNIDNVEFLSFEQCLFYFNNYKFDVAEIIQSRNKPLQVNLHQNYFEETKLPWVWSTDGESYLFNIVEGRNYDYTYETIYMTL